MACDRRSYYKRLRLFLTFAFDLLNGSETVRMPNGAIYTMPERYAGGTAKLRFQIPALRQELRDIMRLLTYSVVVLPMLWMLTVTFTATVFLTVYLLAKLV